MRELNEGFVPKELLDLYPGGLTMELIDRKGLKYAPLGETSGFGLPVNIDTPFKPYVDH
jgi:hypothetical protein